jgi:hypothetical protein
MTDSTPTSWRGIVYGTDVLAADGTRVGTVREVLGSDQEDIFHGIRVARSGHRDAMIAAEDLSDMTTTSLTTSLTSAEVGALPDYDETATYHLASVGWLRKHLGWTKDSKSDEEPG